MVLDGDTIKWAPRVPRRFILTLYESHATGQVDEGLLSVVGEMMFNRCLDIGEATSAALGNMICPGCQAAIVHDPKLRTKTSVVQCPDCDWSSTWGDYQKTFQHKQLSGGGATEIFEEFIRKYPSANSASEKMLLVDWMIHQCHINRASKDPEERLWTRPAAVNLIEGSMGVVMDFLDYLAETPGTRDNLPPNYAQWRERVLSGIGGRKPKPTQGADVGSTHSKVSP